MQTNYEFFTEGQTQANQKLRKKLSIGNRIMKRTADAEVASAGIEGRSRGTPLLASEEDIVASLGFQLAGDVATAGGERQDKVLWRLQVGAKCTRLPCHSVSSQNWLAGQEQGNLSRLVSCLPQ